MANSKFKPEDHAAQAMKQIVHVIGINMGFLDKGNDKEYLDLIRAELGIDLRVLEIRLVEFYTKYPFDPYLGYSVKEVRRQYPEYERAAVYDQGGLGDYDDDEQEASDDDAHR